MTIGIGDALREAREQQGRSIDEASRETRIRVEYLDALEDEDFAAIGGDVYTKGFLTTYARWLGIDPDPLLEHYRREVQGADYDAHALIEHPVAKPAQRSRSAWPLWVGAAAIILLASFYLIGQIGGRGIDPAEVPDEFAATGGPPNPAETQQTAPPGGDGTATPTPSPTSVNLVLLVEDRSWMQVRVQDQVVFEGTLSDGESREFSAGETVQLHLGNAGGVRLVLNGDDLGPPGDPGQVWRGVCELDGCSEAA